MRQPKKLENVALLCNKGWYGRKQAGLSMPPSPAVHPSDAVTAPLHAQSAAHAAACIAHMSRVQGQHGGVPGGR